MKTVCCTLTIPLAPQMVLIQGSSRTKAPASLRPLRSLSSRAFVHHSIVTQSLSRAPLIESKRQSATRPVKHSSRCDTMLSSSQSSSLVAVFICLKFKFSSTISIINFVTVILRFLRLRRRCSNSMWPSVFIDVVRSFCLLVYWLPFCSGRLSSN